MMGKREIIIIIIIIIIYNLCVWLPSILSLWK
jgi:hypothetical protein